MEFKCSGCEYKSEKKFRINEHINKIVKCSSGIISIVNIPLDIKCEYCNKEFNTKPSMRRHLVTCKIRKYKLENENKKLKTKILEIENKPVKITSMDCEMFENYIYILREREFVKSSEHVYKIGITKSVKNRMGNYPKGSSIISIIPVNGDPEKLCLEKLRETFIHRKDIGSEYFEGDIKSIVKIVTKCCVFDDI
jgi:hypothetical protein